MRATLLQGSRYLLVGEICHMATAVILGSPHWLFSDERKLTLYYGQPRIRIISVGQALEKTVAFTFKIASARKNLSPRANTTRTINTVYFCDIREYFSMS